MAKKIACTLSENSPMASASSAESARPPASPRASALPTGPQSIRGEPYPIGADAEEHHMREGDDAGIAEQHVVRRRERRHHADLLGDAEGFDARKQERRRQQSRRDQRDENARGPAPGRIAGEQPHLAPSG